jgi:hypothetical protein
LYRPDSKLARVPPAASLQEGGEELTLTPYKILDEQVVSNKRRFLVSFVDRGPEFNQWLPRSALTQHPDLLQQFQDQQKITNRTQLLTMLVHFTTSSPLTRLVAR